MDEGACAYLPKDRLFEIDVFLTDVTHELIPDRLHRVDPCLTLFGGQFAQGLDSQQDQWGISVGVDYALAPGVTAESVQDWCREHMARFKVPRTVVFGPLPKTSTGKIQKFVLREEARNQ